MRPRIGILAGIGSWEERERYFVNSAYVEAIYAAGGLPLIIPPLSDFDAYLPLIDGLLLPGGIDLDPALYGEEPQRGLGKVDPRLDKSEQDLIGAASRAALPILGICRGMQALVVAMGGKLYQDLQQAGTKLAHRQSCPPEHPWHQIEVDVGSRLGSILGTKLRVNSFHHQGAKEVVGLVPVARSADGFVEAVEGEKIIGVQWHPELIYKTDPRQFKLFQAFVEAAAHGMGTHKSQS